MKIVKIGLFVTGICLASIGVAKVEKQTITEIEKTITREFCSKKSESEAQNKCKNWLQEQKSSLKSRLLTSWCSGRQSGDISGCMYMAAGEIRYLLRETTTKVTTPSK